LVKVLALVIFQEIRHSALKVVGSQKKAGMKNLDSLSLLRDSQKLKKLKKKFCGSITHN